MTNVDSRCMFETEAEGRIAALSHQLDLPAKVRLVSGSGCWTTAAEPAIGLDALVLSDGPAGVRGEYWDERAPSFCLPCPTALAATWDEEIVAELCELLAAEAIDKGVHVLLGPTLNLQRSPLAGRHFEAFSEDPLLSGRIGAAYVRALQSFGVAASPKHYVGNDSEDERFTVDVRIAERVLREVYLQPFEAVVAAGAWLVMSAYNKVNGEAMTESGLLADPLKSEWGFDGVVVSDWTAVRSTVASAAGNNDLAMPGPSEEWGAPLLAAVRDGLVPVEAIDRKVQRILRLAGRVGALAGVGPARATVPEPADARALLRRAAATGMVLLRNEEHSLPLEPGSIRRIAVLGPNAATPQIQGGGSATVVPRCRVSPLDGLRRALGDQVEVAHATGAFVDDGLPPIAVEQLVNPVTGGVGMRVRMLGPDGTELHAEDRVAAQFVWSLDDLQGVFAIEISAILRPVASGVHRVGVSGLGDYRLSVGEKTLVEESIGEDAASALPTRFAEIELDPARPVELVLAHRLTPGGLNGLGASFILGLQLPRPDDEELMAQAVALAAHSDVAVVVVGTSPRSESEGSDRRGLMLPGRQDELVHAVARVNHRTVVVVNSGAPVAIPWHEEVPALLLSWFPGQENGDALADVLLGIREPGGRLPTTWGVAESDVPVLRTAPDAGKLEYREGLNIGYRAWLAEGVAPAYFFGHGLGYTSWEYRSIDVAGHSASNLTVRVELANIGDRAGREVVQVYLQRPESGLERPPLWLAGFTVAMLEAKKETVVEVDVPARAFQHWSTESARWETEPGEFVVLAGSSAGWLPLRTYVVQPEK